ncbi:hypothetical protein [Dactylosporangium sp. NPDC000521]|uniref:hypothetical protein n=1 Tax=Dactylosporangium sp. NPDC000521 TaxID=3363975 RepID=UPI00369817FE
MQAEQDAESRRSEAIVGFLSAGLDVPPSRAVIVSALGEARRVVRGRRELGLGIGEWLDGEVRLRGVRENAAVLAVLEVPEWRDGAAGGYRGAHPERAGVLEAVLAVIGQAPVVHRPCVVGVRLEGAR